MRCSSDGTKGESPCGSIVGSFHSGGYSAWSTVRRKPARQQRRAAVRAIGYEWKADKFFYFLFFMIVNFVYYALFGMMLIACTPSQLLANILVAFVLSQWNNFAGFIIARPLMPVWWRWFYWANPVSWTIYGVLGSQFGDSSRNVTVTGQTNTVTVKDFLKDNFGYKHDFLGYVVLAHFGYVIVFFFLFGYGIKYLNFQKR